LGAGQSRRRTKTAEQASDGNVLQGRGQHKRLSSVSGQWSRPRSCESTLGSSSCWRSIQQEEAVHKPSMCSCAHRLPPLGGCQPSKFHSRLSRMSRQTNVLPTPGTLHHHPDTGQQTLPRTQPSLHATGRLSQAKLLLRAGPAYSTTISARQVSTANPPAVMLPQHCCSLIALA
jgi:hypothetical protein